MKRLSALIVAVLLSSACLLSGCDEKPNSSLFGANAELATVYTATGEILKQYHDCDVIHISSGVVQINEHKGKVYVYYNCYVEVVRGGRND